MEHTSQVDTSASADSSCGCCQTSLDAGEAAQDWSFGGYANPHGDTCRGDDDDDDNPHPHRTIGHTSTSCSF